MSGTVLVIDDEKDIRSSLKGILEDEGYEVILASCGEDGIEMAVNELPDVILLDIWMPGIDGIETLARLKEDIPNSTVIMISGHGTIETAVKATKNGAFDFIEKPLSLEKVLITVANAMELKKVITENIELKKSGCAQNRLVGSSDEIKKVIADIPKIAATDSAVLITGAAGTGKSLIASIIHSNSRRKEKLFKTVRCGTLPDELIESEIFGHEKGAFTSAISRKKGALEAADGGTIFFDEINSLSLKTQGLLLKFIKERKFERIGGNKDISSSARIIASSTTDLKELAAKGDFIEELYFAISVIAIKVSPLNERTEDIAEIAKYFVCRFASEEGLGVKTISDDLAAKLTRLPLKGNAKELKNIVERLFIISNSDVISFDDSDVAAFDVDVTDDDCDADVLTLKSAREQFEKSFIIQKLKENEWNVSKTAESIGVERSNLHRKIKSFGIEAN